jgi:hypothetical protein
LNVAFPHILAHNSRFGASRFFPPLYRRCSRPFHSIRVRCPLVILLFIQVECPANCSFDDSRFWIQQLYHRCHVLVSELSTSFNFLLSLSRLDGIGSAALFLHAHIVLYQLLSRAWYALASSLFESAQLVSPVSSLRTSDSGFSIYHYHVSISLRGFGVTEIDLRIQVKTIQCHRLSIFAIRMQPPLIKGTCRSPLYYLYAQPQCVYRQCYLWSSSLTLEYKVKTWRKKRREMKKKKEMEVVTQLRCIAAVQ